MLLVVGPHRSGTSTVARALECLGAVNSPNLMPPSEANPKGYFEDNDVYLFNDQVLLPALERSWLSIAPVDWTVLSKAKRSRLEAQALEIVRRNYPLSQPLSVLKEPRISALLPFWLPVLQKAGFEVKMVGVVRDPLSVARSLQARDGFSLTHGSLLYLTMWLNVLGQSEEAPLSFASFENVLDEPDRALRHLATHLRVTVPEDFPERVADFAASHVDRGLCHNRLDARAIRGETHLPRLVSEFYPALAKTVHTQSPKTCARVAATILQSIHALHPLLADFDRVFGDLATEKEEKRRLENERRQSAAQHEQHAHQLELAVGERDAQITALKERLTHKEQHVAELERVVGQRDTQLFHKNRHVSELESAVGQRDAQITALKERLTHKEQHVAELERVVGQRDTQLFHKNRHVSELESAVGQRDAQITALNERLTHREQRVAELERAVGQRDTQLTALSTQAGSLANTIRELRASTSWKLTAPLRWFSNSGRRIALNTTHLPNRFKLRLSHSRLGNTKLVRRGLDYISRLACRIKRLPNSLRILSAHRKSGLFDHSWYLQQNPDVRARTARPFLHFAFHGVFEGRPPHAGFDPAYYAENNPDIAAASTSPLLHYVLWGYRENRPWQIVSSAAPSLAAPTIPITEFDDTKETYTPYQDHEPLQSEVKLIAFYLPQFHPFPENDEWWGKGFTEWTNVGKAFPNFVGHYQPHCPIHLGYYDLRVPSVMEEQAKLAKNYGIYGFSYYFYWFGGKTLMERPLKCMLANKNVDMPFCLTWANENWTRRWDGQESNVLIAQKHSENDSIAFIRHLLPYFKDKRYITINGKPVLVVYRPSIIPRIKETSKIWRSEMERAGFPGLYLVSAQTFGALAPKPFGFDAAVEFPPHTSVSSEISKECRVTNAGFHGRIYSYEQAAQNAVQQEEPDYKLFRTAMLSWDNTARKQHASHIFHGFSLLRYKQWLASLCAAAFNSKKYSSDEKFVFINAWNEWAEGTHLEPDQKYGYGYLESTYQVVSKYNKKQIGCLENQSFTKASEVAVVAHIHYAEAWPDLRTHICTALGKNVDVYCSISSPDVAEMIRQDFPAAHIVMYENRGRDILPFINILKIISRRGYVAVCKVHTKKTVYRTDGDLLRHSLLTRLLGSSVHASRIIQMFKSNDSLGLVCPQQFLLAHNDHNMTFDHEVVGRVADAMKLKFRYSYFPAGSMFWFRPEALAPLCQLKESIFPFESGLADGTPAHAVERLFCIAAEHAGFKVEGL